MLSVLSSLCLIGGLVSAYLWWRYWHLLHGKVAREYQNLHKPSASIIAMIPNQFGDPTTVSSREPASDPCTDTVPEQDSRRSNNTVFQSIFNSNSLPEYEEHIQTV